MKKELVKGFNDYSGNDSEKREVIREVIKTTFERYGFEPAETPIVEFEEFVKGNNLNDEAVSDIFKLKDKGKRNLALRYEFTFQLKRLVKGKKLPYKRFQIGPVFRDEPVSSNRFRQFTQCDADIVGSTIKEEAELLSMAYETLKKLGIEPIILVNNRKLLDEILNDLKVNEKNKEQVLREIDKLGKISEKEIKDNLKKLGAEEIISLMKKGEKYFKKFESYKEILELFAYSNIYGLKILFSPTIVRGLSYYNGSVFEIKSKNLKETIVAGGSYICEGFQSTGISFGLERISKISKLDITLEKFLIVSLGEDKSSIQVAKSLRNNGKSVSVYYGKPSKALEYANSNRISKVIFVGKEEIKSKKFKIKDMKTGKEKIIEIKIK